MPLYAYFFLGLIALSYLVRNKDRLRMLFGEQLQLKNDGSLTASQRWAIAAGADLAQRNKQYLDSLATGLTTPAEILREWWGIETREDALVMVEDLAASAHRQLSPGQAAQAALEALVQDGLVPAGAEPPSLLAWDLCRLINICRWCYDVGMMSEQECWKYLLPAAAALQKEYRSWRELSIGYLLGFLAWQDGERGAEYSLLTLNQNVLLSDPRSPWLQLPWSTPLGAAS